MVRAQKILPVVFQAWQKSRLDFLGEKADTIPFLPPCISPGNSLQPQALLLPHLPPPLPGMPGAAALSPCSDASQRSPTAQLGHTGDTGSQFLSPSPACTFPWLGEECSNPQNCFPPEGAVLGGVLQPAGGSCWLMALPCPQGWQRPGSGVTAVPADGSCPCPCRGCRGLSGPPARHCSDWFSKCMGWGGRFPFEGLPGSI